MLYLAPTRRAAAIAIWAVACGIAALILYAAYFFRAGELWNGVRHASFFELSWKAFAMPQAYHQILAQLGQSSPALVLALPMALISYGSLASYTLLRQHRAILGVSFISRARVRDTALSPDWAFSSWPSHSCSSLSPVLPLICWKPAAGNSFRLVSRAFCWPTLLGMSGS